MPGHPIIRLLFKGVILYMLYPAFKRLLRPDCPWKSDGLLMAPGEMGFLPCPSTQASTPTSLLAPPVAPSTFAFGPWTVALHLSLQTLPQPVFEPLLVPDSNWLPGAS